MFVLSFTTVLRQPYEMPELKLPQNFVPNLKKTEYPE